MFMLNKNKLIRFRKVVYFPKLIKKQFVKEIYKKLTLRHIRIKKTRNVVADCYYFPFIFKIVKQVVKECNIC